MWPDRAEPKGNDDQRKGLQNFLPKPYWGRMLDVKALPARILELNNKANGE